MIKKKLVSTIKTWLFTLLFSCFFMNTVVASTPLGPLQNQLNGIDTPKAINESNKPFSADREHLAESIDPQSGSLTLKQTDLELPGKDGLNLNLTRLYSSSQAQLGEMKSSFDLTSSPTTNEQTNHYYWYLYTGTVSGKILNHDDGGVQYKTSALAVQGCTNFANSTAGYNESYECRTFPEDGTIYHINEREYVYCNCSYINYFKLNNITTNTSYVRSKYDLGAGWSFGFPSVQKVESHYGIKGEEHYSETVNLYLHDGTGAVYQAFGTYKDENGTVTGSTNLVNYPVDNVVFNYDYGTYSNGQDSSAYVFVDQDKKKTYFSNDGRVLGIVDRFNNTIKFEYVGRNINGVSNSVISKITDSIGRIVSFTYDSTINNSAFNGENITVTVNHPSSSKTESIQYTKYRDVVNGRYEPKLWRVTLAYGSSDAASIYYDYDLKTQRFRYDTKNLDSSSATIPLEALSKVTYPNSVTHYQYESVSRNFGADGLMDGFRATARYDSELRYNTSISGWVENGDFNHVNYTYTNDETGYPSYASESSIPATYEFSSTSTMVSNGLKTISTFNGKKQPIKVETVASNGEKKITKNISFHPTFKFNPTRTEYDDYATNGVTYNALYVDKSYNAWGGLESVTQPLTLSDINTATTKKLYTMTFQYDPVYKFIKQQESYQNASTQLTASKTYTSTGRIESETNGNGETTNYAYSTLQDGSFQIDVTKTLENGTTAKTTTVYDTTAKVAYPTKIASYYKDETGTTRETASYKTYDILLGLVKTESDSNGNTTSYSYDHLGRSISIQSPSFKGQDGVTYSTEQKTEYSFNQYDDRAFDSTNQFVSTTKVKAYTNITNATQNGNITKTYGQTITYYDGFGNTLLQQRFDDSKNQWIPQAQFHYDTLKRPIYMIDATNNVNTAAYDSWGNVQEQTDAYGNLYHTDIDLYNRKQSSFFIAQGNINTYRTNPASDSVKENLLDVTYDQYGRATTRSAYPNFPDRVMGLISQTFSYDLAGNMTSYKDPRGKTTTYVFDKLNRLYQFVDALQQTTTYNYNQLGSLKSFQQTDGTQTWMTSKEYDEVGRLTKKIDPAGVTESYKFNQLGQVTQKTDANQVTFGNSYDGFGRQITVNGGNSKFKTYFESSPFGASKVEEYTGDTLLRSASFSYTPMGLLQSKTVSNEGYTNTLTNQYDAAGKLVRVQDPFSFMTQYTYNKTRLDIVQTNGSEEAYASDAQYAKYAYNPNGTLSSITYPKLSDGTYLKTNYTYDKVSRVLSVTNTKGTQTLSSFNYTYDPNGNIQTVNDITGTTSYVYDNLNRLLEVHRPNGNIIYYTYDARGNRRTTQNSLISMSLGDNSYDVWNQLTQVNTSSGTTNFQYDHEGLRIKKLSSTDTLRYTYNSSGKVIAESDETNSVKANYVWGTDRLLVKNDPTSSAQYYYLYNGHGDVVQVVDTNGTLQNNYQYDEWGNILSQTEKVKNSFKYAGEQFDDETGLYYLRARYYDPSVGRFINKDTYEGQIDNPLSLNLYTYVENNPLTRTDPSGHRTCDSEGECDPIKLPSNDNIKTYVTADQLKNIGFKNVNDSMVNSLNLTLEKYNITTTARIRHFLAQTLVESAYGARLTEMYNDPEEVYFKQYDNRNGNSKPGDGSKYRGAGYIQITGKDVYEKFSERALDPKILDDGYSYVANNYPWEAAGYFWSEYKNINPTADKGDSAILTVSIKVNGKNINGLPNGWSERQKAYKIVSEYVN